MYKGAPILVVEDEILIAMDLAMAIEAAGGLVLGPATTTVAALALIEEAVAANMVIAAALLDTNLADRDVTPVALRLLDLGVPIVMHSAVGPPPGVKASANEISWVCKPASARRVVASLSYELGRTVPRKTDGKVVDPGRAPNALEDSVKDTGNFQPADRDYCLAQARQHRQAADQASDFEIRRLNDQLANRYANRAAAMSSEPRDVSRRHER